MYRVLLIQRVVAPYRLPFFRRLHCSDKLEVTFAYGDSSADKTIRSPKESPSDWRVINLQNLYWRETEQICWQRGLLSSVNPHRFDVIIAEFNPRILTNVLACFSSKLYGIPFIWWGIGLSVISDSRIRKQVRKSLLNIASAGILYDNSVREEFISLGIPQEKLFVAYNSIDTDTIEELKHRLGNRQRFRILFIGRLIERKKLPLLLLGFAHAKSHLPDNTVLTIIGDGPERQRLQALAEELKINDSVELPGAIYDEAKIASYFAESRLSVAPGQAGLAAIHSLAYGVPFLVADNEPHDPSIGVLAQSKAIAVFPSENLEALAKEMIRLVTVVSDSKDMVKRGGEIVAQRYSLAAMVRTFEQAVEFAVQKSKEV